MSATNCQCPCPDPTITEIPGAPGEDGAAGAAGTNGVDAFTTLTANATIPAIGANVTVSVVNSTWMGIGQVVWLTDGTDKGSFEVISKPGATSATLEFLGYANDSAPGAIIGSGGTVSPGGTQPTFSPPADLTNNTTGVAAAALAAGAGILTLSIPHTFIGGTAAVEPVTSLVIPFKFKILSWYFVTEVALVGGGGSRVANMEIGTTDVGSVPSTCTILIAATAVGTVTAGTAIAGANTGNAGDNISIEIAAGGTAFTAGSGTFVINIQNMDVADAIASLNASITAINATL